MPAELDLRCSLSARVQRSAAVFLDRDGTLIEDRGHLRSPSEVVFFPDTVPALTRLRQRFRLFIVTHQPGIAKGIVAADEVARTNEFIVAELRRRGIVISDVYCCPHNREDGCACVKPKPYFLQQAADSYGVDLSHSFAVGDHPHDVALAENAGGAGVYVLTGHGAKHRRELPEGRAVVPGIREAAEWVLAAHAKERQDRLRRSSRGPQSPRFDNAGHKTQEAGASQ